jgi:hypothetical protein
VIQGGFLVPVRQAIHAPSNFNPTCKIVDSSIKEYTQLVEVYMTKRKIRIYATESRIRYSYREDYENVSAVSMELKQTCTTHRSSRKARHSNALMNDIGQKKHASIALLTGTIRSFVLTWRNKDGRYPTTYKRNSINTSNVADWSMGFARTMQYLPP